MDRRHSEDGDMTPRQEPGDVFADEFEVDEFDIDMVADGFRPDSARPGDERHSQDPPIHTASAHYATDPDMITPAATPHRNSISKPRSNENPFASPDDEPRLEFERTPSMHSQSTMSFAPGNARRSTSSASSHVFASTGSGRFGADGPSHPYAMYPQGTIPRSPSIATTSTVQPTRTPSVQHAPQHPYAMYPQGVTEDVDLEDEDETQAAAPAVGFPGLGQQFQRVRGPEGEEQDIIGVDGHTEQLPPYTRYPEDGPKMPMLAVPGELHSRGPVAGSDPGMPLMHQHMPPPNPPPTMPQSMTDQSALERHSMQDRGVDQQASLPLMERVSTEHTRYSGDSEKSWKEKSWKEKRKTKFCGIPFLWLLMGICAAGFIGAIVGGIMGGYASGSKHGREKSEAETSSSVSAAEARIIATPTISPPPGTFALSLSTPTQVQSGCLANSDSQPAWDCNLAGSPALAISVGQPAAPRPTDGAFFFYASSDPKYEYGAQYRFMNTDFAPFQPVQESGDEDQGPAFYFSQKYDKIVVLPESTFPTPTAGTRSKNKRDDFQLPKGWHNHKQAISHGDKPWFCVWNDTLIEGWIYVEKPVTSGFPITTTSSSPISLPTSNSTPAEASASTYTSSPSVLVSGAPVLQTDTTATYVSSPSSGSRYTTTVTKTSIATTPTLDSLRENRGPPSGNFDDWPYNGNQEVTSSQARRRDRIQRRADNDDDDDDDDNNDADSTTSSSAAAATTSSGRLSPEEEEALDTYHSLEVYPYLIKIEERRVPDNDNTPYCQQFQLLENGGWGYTTQSDQVTPIRFDLDENPPNYIPYATESGSSQKLRSKRSSPADGCHCEWWGQ